MLQKITKQNMSRKLALGLAALALALSLGVAGAMAASLTQAQISAIVSLLSSFGADQGTINNVTAALGGQATTGSTGTSVSAGYNYTRDLTIGSSGADVTALQNTLIAAGDSIAAGATGYFGSQTQSALAKWQAANGISPASGYFGPITRAKISSTSMTTTGGTTTTTTTTTTGQGAAQGITTVGKEGIMTVDLNPTPSSGQNIYVTKCLCILPLVIYST